MGSPATARTIHSFICVWFVPPVSHHCWFLRPTYLRSASCHRSIPRTLPLPAILPHHHTTHNFSFFCLRPRYYTVTTGSATIFPPAPAVCVPGWTCCWRAACWFLAHCVLLLHLPVPLLHRGSIPPPHCTTVYTHLPHTSVSWFGYLPHVGTTCRLDLHARLPAAGHRYLLRCGFTVLLCTPFAHLHTFLLYRSTYCTCLRSTAVLPATFHRSFLCSPLLRYAPVHGSTFCRFVRFIPAPHLFFYSYSPFVRLYYRSRSSYSYHSCLLVYLRFSFWFCCTTTVRLCVRATCLPFCCVQLPGFRRVSRTTVFIHACHAHRSCWWVRIPPAAACSMPYHHHYTFPACAGSAIHHIPASICTVLPCHLLLPFLRSRARATCQHHATTFCSLRLLRAPRRTGLPCHATYLRVLPCTDFLLQPHFTATCCRFVSAPFTTFPQFLLVVLPLLYHHHQFSSFIPSSNTALVPRSLPYLPPPFLHTLCTTTFFIPSFWFLPSHLPATCCRTRMGSFAFPALHAALLPRATPACTCTTFTVHQFLLYFTPPLLSLCTCHHARTRIHAATALPLVLPARALLCLLLYLPHFLPRSWTHTRHLFYTCLGPFCTRLPHTLPLHRSSYLPAHAWFPIHATNAPAPCRFWFRFSSPYTIVLHGSSTCPTIPTTCILDNSLHFSHHTTCYYMVLHALHCKYL